MSRWLKVRHRAGKILGKTLGIPGAAFYTERILVSGECHTAIDIGCGVSSPLTKFRPALRTLGIDAHVLSLELARRQNVHDEYVVADVVELSLAELLNRVREVTGETKFDLVTAYGIIEHLPKMAGWKLLDQCEALSKKFILLETPNGFVAQGPEYGNPMQKHLSGWFPHDFQSLGYTVYGTTGTKYLRGYMGEARYSLPGILMFDQVILSRLLRCDKRPQHAFNIVAIKDVRGVPARYSLPNAA
jgi:hypothetical protein